MGPSRPPPTFNSTPPARTSFANPADHIRPTPCQHHEPTYVIARVIRGSLWIDVNNIKELDRVRWGPTSTSNTVGIAGDEATIAIQVSTASGDIRVTMAS